MRNGEKSWEADFPMREEVEDHAGRTRSFVINCHEGGLGWTVRAHEVNEVVPAASRVAATPRVSSTPRATLTRRPTGGDRRA